MINKLDVMRASGKRNMDEIVYDITELESKN